MEIAYQGVLRAHIAAGAVGLLSMLVPLLAAKGSRLHRRAGWVFVAAMAAVSLTGLLIALGWLLAPLQVRPPSRAVSPEAIERYASMLRSTGVFFAFIAVFVASACWQGIVATRQRRGTIRWGNPVDRTFAWLSIGLGAAVGMVGLSKLDPIFIGFGALGVYGGLTDLRFYRRAEFGPGTWVLRHLQAMIGGATAAVTAFTVQGLGRTLERSGHGEWLLVAWTVPVVLGMLASHLWTRRMRRVVDGTYTGR